MASETTGMLLRDLLAETKDGEWGKDQPFEDSREMLVIRGTDFPDARVGELSSVPTRHISGKAAIRKELKANDILIETAGGSKGRPTGRTILISDQLLSRASLPVTCASFARFLRVDPTLADPAYVFWFLQAQYASGEIERHQVQHSGIARFQYTKFASEVVVPLPSREEQTLTAKTLGILDDKIALLRETNATLEAIAQAIFKSWFVDFDPVRAKAEGCAKRIGQPSSPMGCDLPIPEGVPPEVADLFPSEFEDSELGAIPKGWRVATFQELTEVLGGSTPSTKDPMFWEEGVHYWATPKDLSGMDTPVLLETERKITDTGLEKISSGLLPIGTVLLSSRAPIGYLAIAEVPVAINQGFIAMKARRGVSNLFLLRMVQARMDDIKSRANGSTFLEISKGAFRPIPVLVPSAVLMQAFDGLVRPLYQRLVENQRERATLTDLRDSLLPRLMSGKLRIPDVEVALT